jgi:signal transduction histidine kinase
MLGIAVRNAGVVTRLKELNEFRDAMLQMAAHDLRAPLSHVVAYLELIREDEAAPAEQRQQWYAVTGQALERMAHLINGILDYTRAGHEDHLKRQQVDLTAIGREAIDDLEEAAAAKSQKIELRASPADTWVQGDASLLREAVRNLVANAVAYSPPGTTITVSTSRTRGNVRLAVADGGPGIPEEELPALFQPFRRLSTSVGTEGTGLGLSLVKRIVEQHGGRVEVESVVGEGSTFEIVLAHAPAKDVAPAGLSRSSSQSPRA